MTTSQQHAAIYVRISHVSQDTRSQLPELEAWASRSELPVVWYTDKATGTTMDRVNFQRMMAAVNRGEVATVVCYRLDRLGRNTVGVVSLFEHLRECKVNLVSIKDGLDLSTSSGRLQASILASVASYETEVRKSRQCAGILAAKASGKTWGGRKKGDCWKVDDEKIAIARKMKDEGKGISTIARTLSLSRPTIYRLLERGV